MILEAIYSGDFYPSETVVPKSEKYRNALKACEKIMDQLAEKLSKEDYDLVEELQDQASIAQSEENECHFKVGFSAGLLVQGSVNSFSQIGLQALKTNEVSWQ